jgi:hypothetical protein
MVPVLAPEDIAPEALVRVVPRPVSPDAVPVFQEVQRARDGKPLPRAVKTDWKCFPGGDLYDWLLAPDIFCSRRFVDSLIEVGARGWRAEPVEHATPNLVVGHEHYRLSVQAFTGPFTRTTKLKALPGKKKRAFGLAGAPVGVPELQTGDAELDHIAWTGWLKTETIHPWRALVVSGRFVAALRKRSPEMTVVFQPIETSGPAARTTRLPAGELKPAPRRAAAIPLATALQELRSEPGTMLFRAPQPKERGGAAWRERVAGRLGSVAPLEALYRECNGGTFLGTALTFLPLEPVAGDLPTMDAERANRCGPGQIESLPEDAILFARNAQHSLFWACDPAGIVRGYGLDGDIYGPAAPFGDWLHDQLVDLRFIFDGRHQLPWTGAYL